MCLVYVHMVILVKTLFPLNRLFLVIIFREEQFRLKAFFFRRHLLNDIICALGDDGMRISDAFEQGLRCRVGKRGILILRQFFSIKHIWRECVWLLLLHLLFHYSTWKAADRFLSRLNFDPGNLLKRVRAKIEFSFLIKRIRGKILISTKRKMNGITLISCSCQIE